MLNLKNYHAALVAMSIVGDAQAFWRMNCGIQTRGRLDPLTNPGTISPHTHTVLGGSNFGAYSTGATIANSSCTSCEISADKSAYWTPTLFYQYGNGSFQEVPHNGGVVYYLGRGPNRNKSVAFPNGLSILSGKPTARSYDNQTMTWGNSTYPPRPVADRVSFACLKDNQPPQQAYMFDTDCPYGMRAQIQYQSCWNGKDLYTTDNSHVAYLSQIDNGICPPTHPIQMAHLFMETLYSVNNVAKESGGRFVFSQGDATGYGFHADFQNGWDTNILRQAINNGCLSGGSSQGTIQECPILQKYQTSAGSFNCPERPSGVNETVRGMLAQLPGCNQVTTGPATAPPSTCPANYMQPSLSSQTTSNGPQPTTVVAPGQPWPNNANQTYLGCYPDQQSSRLLGGASTTNSIGMTVDMCQAYCKNKGFRLSGVEYASECYCDNGIPAGVTQASSGCNYNCAGTQQARGTQQICGGASRINIYNNTDPTFSGPQIKSPVGSYVSQGCLTDPRSNGGARSLSQYSTSSNTMTPDLCVKTCQAKQYSYAGVEYGAECYCGNSINTSGGATNVTCPMNKLMTCAGDKQSYCGGPSLLNLYQLSSSSSPQQLSASKHS